MPPKVSFTREKIIDAAVSLVRREGVGKLNARSVAREIQGSTQPIYRVFTSIDELEEAVIEKVTPLALKYMLEAEDDESAFLSIGLGYLKFAREEPQFFDLLFVRAKKKWNFTSRSPLLGPVVEKMRRDWYLKNLDDRILLGLFRDMFIYTHGLCTLQSIDIDRADPAQERKLLHDVGGQLIAMTVIREKKPAVLEEMYRSLMS